MHMGGDALNEVDAHDRPRRPLEAKVQAITLTGNINSLVGLEDEPPPIQWVRKSEGFFRREHPTIDGYCLDLEKEPRERRCSVQSAIIEGLDRWRKIWIHGLSDEESIELLTNHKYFFEFASQSERVLNGRIVFFQSYSWRIIEPGEEF